MKLKKLLIVTLSAVMLTGIGLFAKTNYHANASQPYRIIRYLNNHNNHCYYSYEKNNENPNVVHNYYQKGYEPKSFRRGHFVMLIDPYLKNQRRMAIKRIHGHKYYIDDTYYKVTHKRTYFSLYIPTNDISRSYKKRNARLYKIYNARERRDEHQAHKHKYNKKIVNKYINDEQNHFLVYSNLKYNTRHNR